MKKKILLTGGAGYIGSHVLNLLGRDNSFEYEITIIDNLSTGRRESIFFGELIVESLENTDFLNQLFRERKFDAIMHFAGSIVVPESVQNPGKYYANNTQNSLQLLDLCRKYHVKNFIFSSTAAVYGMGVEEKGRCSETSTLNPINPYGRSKLMTEWMMEDFSNAYDFNYIALRYFNVAGASMDGKIGQCTPDATHLLKVACQCATGQKENITIFGTNFSTHDGTCIRDYIHVDDLASAHIEALKYLLEGGKSQVLNCGYGKGASVKEVIQAVKRISGVNFSVLEGGPREGDPVELISVANKIQETLKWKPRYNDLDLIVKSALNWENSLLKNKD